MDHSFFEETESIRKHFPIFAHRPEITFLDNASTTQKLQSVIEEASLFYSHNNTNVGRSLCDLDRAAYTQVEKVRAQVHELIHCNSPQEIYFTAGASHSMRTVTEILVHEYLEDGDEVLVCPEDHNSFVSPWYTYKEKYATLGKKINIVEFTVQNDGQIDWGALIKKISHKTRIINLTHIHNVYGSTNALLYDAEKIEFLKQKKILVNVDGAQSFSKVPIDVGSMRIDILHSSGHKTFAPQGTGVVYLNETVFGRRGTDFELGTLHYAGILALGMAVSFMQDIGMTHIDRILEQSTQYLYESMRSTPGIEFTKGVAGCSCKSGSGTISFNLINIAPVEIGQFMNYHSVCVRTGSHCNFLSDASIHSVRVSLHVYTNKADIDKFHSLLATLAHGL